MPPRVRIDHFKPNWMRKGHVRLSFSRSKKINRTTRGTRQKHQRPEISRGRSCREPGETMPQKKGVKPNILVIFGDDIGIWNLSCYSDGMMGYRTPNIDRLAREGMRFTDSYGEQSCTAGRSSFITGQSCFRTGLSKVGIPASPIGLQPE